MIVLDLRTHRNLYHALYSDVILGDGRVYKLFKRSIDPQFDARALTKFAAQVEAYNRVGGDEIMCRHSAHFYGTVVIETVIDESGIDVGGTYHLDACYAMEELRGPELKVNDPQILPDYPYIFEVRRRFRDFGIDTSDASVFNYQDPDGFKLIDFETEAFA